MPLSIKVNLRVTGHCNQGGRKYMEDMFSVAYQQTSDDKDLEYAFFGIFDGHGGGEAATFAKEHLMDIIVKQKNFWSDKDEDVLRAIRDGYVNTHYAMWRELDKWPRTASGLPSTAGTTASIAFIRKGKIYIGHVGDSGIILGYQDEGDPQWKARPLTRDHKPESGPEMIRIQESGGKVVSKSGVPRVVWNRPRIGHKGPVRRSTHIDEIPFLAVARSLGDLWSYNSELDTFVVSPEPDVKVVTVDVKSHRCLIFGTDGLWNMLTPQAAVSIVQAAERHNEKHFIASQQTGNGTDTQMWINPSKSLVDRALERWSSTRLRADNTSVVTLMLDPPGPSRGEVLLSRKKERVPSPKAVPISPSFTPIVTAPTPMIPEMIQTAGTIDHPVLPQASPLKPEPAPLCPQAAPQESIHDNELLDTSKEPKVNSAKESRTEVRETKTVCAKDVKNHSKDQKSQQHPIPEGTAPQESKESLESIQVAEVSSSDTPEPPKSLRTIVNESSDSTSPENPDSPSKDIDVLPSLIPLIHKSLETPKDLQKILLSSTKTESLNLQRQNAFSGSCDELKNGPKLRKSTQFSIQKYNNEVPNLQNQTRRRTHSAITHLDKRGGLLTRNELRSAKRRQNAVNQSQMMPATSSTSLDDKNPEAPDCLRQSSLTTEATAKRRHSSTFENQDDNLSAQEPSSKRRTRSEDRRCPTDENVPVNQEKSSTNEQNRMRWPGNCSISSKTRSSTSGLSCGGANKDGHQDKLPSPGSFQRRSLEKKATPVKTIRRPSINGSSRIQLRGSFALRDWDQSKVTRRTSCSDRRISRSNSESSNTPTRWLRSDTIAATPVKTLRSRNVDITGHTVSAQVAHQYGVVKQNRPGIGKIKLTPGKAKLKQNGIGSGASSSVNGGVNGIAKRVKSVSPYNPSARSLNTRSRLKRLGK